MTRRLKRYAAGLRRRQRSFVASFGPITLWLLHPRRGLGFSLTLVAAFAVLGAGLLDDAAGLVGERHEQAAVAEADRVGDARGHPGAPPLTFTDRLTALTSRLPLDTAAVSGAGAATVELLPGVRGVDYVERCNATPAARMERNGPIRHITVHTSEEDAGPAGVDAVCRYGNSLYERTFYTYYVERLTGVIWRTLPEDVKPYSQKTRNAGDVAIVLQGRANVNVPSEPQLSALYRLVPALAAKYRLGPGDLYGHRDWSRLDAADPRVPADLKNDHTDPGPSWDANHWGLGDRIRANQNPAGVPRPDLTPGASVSGTASYYNPTGNRTAAGDAYDGRALTAATWLVDGKPAYPFGSWLKVCEADRCEVARVNDTGAFVPPRVADLSPRVFANVATGRRRVMCDARGQPAGACWRTDDPDYRAALARGVLNATVTYLGRDGTDEWGQPVAFYPCAANPQLGGFVYGDALRLFRQLTSTRVGCPVDPEPTTPDGVEWRQRFTSGVLRWTPQRGAWFEAAR